MVKYLTYTLINRLLTQNLTSYYDNTSDIVHNIVHEQCNKELGTHDVAYAHKSANTYGIVYANPCADFRTIIAVI